jgi:Putative restriction endonuclease
VPTVFEAVMDAPLPPHKLWTREDCAVMERVGLIEAKRYELIGGDLIRKAAKVYPQSRATMLLMEWLRGIFEYTHAVQGPSIEVDAANEVDPTAVLLHRSLFEFSGPIVADDLRLIVEVTSSTLAFDLTTKARLYARSGIAEYWVLDVDRRRLLVHREPVEGRYQSVVAFGEEERVATLAAPEQDVRVGDLF